MQTATTRRIVPIALLALILALIVLFVGVWRFRAHRDAAPDVPSPTPPTTQTLDPTAQVFRIALVAFHDSESEIWKSAAKNLNLEISTIPKDEFLTFAPREYDVVLTRVIGWVPTDAERQKAREILDATLSFGHTQTLDFGRDLTNVSDEFVPDVTACLVNISEENARRCAARLAQAISAARPDEKRVLQFVAGEKSGERVEAAPAVMPPSAGFFYFGDRVDETYDAFEARRRDEGRLDEANAPRVALFGDFLDPFKALDRKPLDELMRKLEARGFNVYPIYKIQNNRELLKECRPDVAIYFPRGRVFQDGKAPELFRELNIPVLTAVLLTTTEEEWRSQPIGATGSYYSLATALPELDGAIEPLAIGTRETNEDGLALRAPLSERIDRLVERCDQWVKLRRTPNNEKKLAIFYYKAPGAAALVAQSLEVVDSLYNLLTRLRDEGYDLGEDFPESSDELGKLIQERGRTIGAWALGDFARFVRDADPEIVSEGRYRKWFNERLSEAAREKIVDAWGAPPGDLMTADVDDAFGIVVPRILLGNVALIPQPTTDVALEAPYDPQDNDFDAVHGTEKAPPHFYFAAYFWARLGFNADAILHFGTHGSLEFTKGKTGFLTESCFPDALIGDVPHVYLYSINNIGEAALAKRRARATIISHLTPPFTKSELYGDLETLDSKTHEFEAAEDPLLQRELARSITELVLKGDLIDDLIDLEEFADFQDESRRKSVLESDDVFTNEQIEALHSLLHRYEEANVTNGLHVLGRAWDEKELQETAELAPIDSEEAKARLVASVDAELDQMIAALNGSYVSPGPGGDFLRNPDAAPTGRNLTGVDMRRMPSVEAERVAERLTDELLDAYRRNHAGAYPRRVVCTLWGGETARTHGVGAAQVFALLGVRVKRDSRGDVNGLELIPSDELGRPRVDVLVQTSGQFRDSFGTLVALLDESVKVAANAPADEPFPNYPRENAQKIARQLVENQGLSESEAEDLATARVFGATNALSYGTGVMNLVERGDLWESETDVALRYVANMSGVYRNENYWGRPTAGLLEYNLADVDMTAQTRSSNTWGPAKLDHIYEFSMIAAAARAVSGRDPEIWFDDLRNPNGARVESARAALREELRSTLWNPKYLNGLKSNGASAAESVAKTTRNLFGWRVVQPSQIDDEVWNHTSEVLVDDSLNLGVREWFEEKNPSALQDATATLLEAVRKGFWNADDETVKKVAKLHAELVAKFGPSGSYESTGERSLQEFIRANLTEDLAEEYDAQIEKATTPELNQILGMTLVETTHETPEPQDVAAPTTRLTLALALAAVACLFVLVGFYYRPASLG